MKKRTKENWECILVQQEQSGLSQRLFCEKFGVPYHGFRGARGRYLKEKRQVDSTEAGLRREQKPRPSEPDTGGFLEVELVGDGLQPPLPLPSIATDAGSTERQKLEVQLPYGVVLRFGGLQS